ncbi:unnamed protein product [Adineta steineri]|uniref:Uncharacterized protein n=1 Tax=Adineta steineri TaxID=433720 RepID=A0A815T6J3_9BILA|nr:unnamed protein product [Adineta steineri]
MVSLTTDSVQDGSDDSASSNRSNDPVHGKNNTYISAEIIIDYCEKHNLFEINIAKLVPYFSDKENPRQCVKKLFELLIQQKRLILKSEYENHHQSNFSRKFKQLLKSLASWLPFRTSMDQNVFIVEDRVQKKAEQVIYNLQSNVGALTLGFNVSYVSFIDACRQCGLTDEYSCKLVKSALARNNKIFIDNDREFPIVKSAVPEESSIQSSMDIGKDIYQLGNFKKKLKKKLNKINDEIEEINTKPDTNKLYSRMKKLQHQRAKRENMLDSVITALTVYEYYPYKMMFNDTSNELQQAYNNTPVINDAECHTT